MAWLSVSAFVSQVTIYPLILLDEYLMKKIQSTHHIPIHPSLAQPGQFFTSLKLGNNQHALPVCFVGLWKGDKWVAGQVSELCKSECRKPQEIHLRYLMVNNWTALYLPSYQTVNVSQQQRLASPPQHIATVINNDGSHLPDPEDDCIQAWDEMNQINPF